MFPLFLKELKQFFSSLMGYLSIIVFLIALGLFNWVFPQTSIPDFGYAHMDGFFGTAPFILSFLIPAITMRSFSEELQNGTFEFLLTKPLNETQIILGKFLAAWFLVFLSILPTITYVISLYLLATPVGNIDLGGIIGSYIGLLLLAGVFCAIGIFTSSITNNQIVAFILGLTFCFISYYAFGYLSELSSLIGRFDYLIEQIGLQSHFNSLSRGVIDSRDVVHFFSFAALFLLLTRIKLESRTW